MACARGELLYPFPHLIFCHSPLAVPVGAYLRGLDLSTQLCRLELFTIDLARLTRTAAPLGRPFDVNCWPPRVAPAGADWLRCGASGSPSALGVLGLKVSATSHPCSHLCNFGVPRYLATAPPPACTSVARRCRQALGLVSVCSTPAGRWVPRYGVLPLWIS